MYGLKEPLDRLMLKVERAKKHILDLESERGRFFKDEAYTFAPKINPQTGQREFYATTVRDIPLTFSVILSDVLHNLRSALDHTTWHLACVGTGKVSAHRDAMFPIGENASDYEARRKRIEACLRADAIKAIDAVEPYGGGAGEIIYHLAILNNFDKHRLLLTAQSSFEGHSVFRSDREFLAKFHGGSPEDYRSSLMLAGTRIFPMKAGDKLFAAPESEVDENMKFAVEVAFAQPGIVKGKFVLETLHEMMNLIRHIIFEFDRNGLFR